MTTFLQQLVNSLTIGSVYVLIALGYTMVYGIIELINFAHGEIYMMGAYMGVIVLGAVLKISKVSLRACFVAEFILTPPMAGEGLLAMTR